VSIGFLGTLAALAGIAGFGAGFIGLGGGLLLFPLLLHVPPLLGMEGLDARTVAALVITQVFFSGVIAGTGHWRRGRVHGELTLTAAVASAAGSFAGGVGSKWVTEWFLLLLFGIVVLLAAATMFLPGPSVEHEMSPVEKVKIPITSLALASTVVGVVVGFLGAGNFTLIPLMIYLFKVPTRIAIGSSLIVHVLNSFSGFLGKLLTGQVPYFMTLVVLVGAGLGAIAGEWSHGRVSPSALRLMYGAVVGVVALATWIRILVWPS